jgi:hypothetical protein
MPHVRPELPPSLRSNGSIQPNHPGGHRGDHHSRTQLSMVGMIEDRHECVLSLAAKWAKLSQVTDSVEDLPRISELAFQFNLGSVSDLPTLNRRGRKYAPRFE